MKQLKQYNFDGHKLIYHMDRVYDHFKYGKRIAPIHIDLGATSACNSNCVYCYALFQKKNGEILPRDVLINLLSDAPKLGVKSIAIIGDGEPLLNPALCEAVVAGKNNGLDISIGTNGQELTEEKTKVLLENSVWFRFNLSAASKYGYQRVHRVDKWDIVKKNIQDAVRIKKENNLSCTIGLQMVLVPQCVDEVLDESDFAISTGVDYLVIKQYSNPLCDEMVKVDMDWYKDEAVIELLKKAEAMSTDKTKIIPKFGLMQWHNDKPYKNCLDLPLLIEISGTGKVYPCGYHFRNPEYCMGDLLKQSFKEIIESDRYWEVVKFMREIFEVGKGCQGACRHDRTNEFINNYLNKPEHINFI